jgi:cytochrome c1
VLRAGTNLDVVRWKDEDPLRKVLCAGLCVPSVLAWLAAAALAAESAPKVLTTRGDGSRTPGVHRIPMYAEGLMPGQQGEKITPEMDPALPFSIEGTCGECHVYQHDYAVIQKGWHFNAADPNVPPGRPGQPWIYVDAATGTQIPLSYRPWPGTFRPSQVGMSSFQFTTRFGRQMPGGGVGELDTENDDEIARQMVSGKLEINCLSCHDRDPAHDQAEYAAQVSSQSFRWAATASAPFAAAKGSAEKMDDTFDYLMPDMVTNPELKPFVPTVTYHKSAFDDKDQVFFNVSGKIPASRCYFCHSEINVDLHGNEKWQGDEDVHLTAGLTCVDCHREGLEHNTIRGYEGEVSDNPLAAKMSCRGCHLGDGSEPPTAGRLGAPVPEHKGIPAIHFERLSCTACHSGPWPVEETYRVKTSQAHGLGTHSVDKTPEALPHIFFPVYVKQQVGATNEESTGRAKIGPHRLIWPAYWGTLADNEVRPVDLATVSRVVGAAWKNPAKPAAPQWGQIQREQIADGLKALGEAIQQKAVYIAGGVLYQLDDQGTLADRKDHPAAAPYMWPLAHNVRPAAQSLGVGQCRVCHSKEASFFFSKLSTDSPVQGDGVALRMADFHQAEGPVNVRVNHFFRWLIIIVMTLLILHILGDLYRRVLVKLRSTGGTQPGQ